MLVLQLVSTAQYFLPNFMYASQNFSIFRKALWKKWQSSTHASPVYLLVSPYVIEHPKLMS